MDLNETAGGFLIILLQSESLVELLFEKSKDLFGF